MPRKVKPMLIDNITFMSEVGINADSINHGLPEPMTLMDLCDVGNSGRHLFHYLGEDLVKLINECEELNVKAFPVIIHNNSTYFRYVIEVNKSKYNVSLKAKGMLQSDLPNQHKRRKRLDSMSLEILERLLGYNPIKSEEPVRLYNLHALKLQLEGESDLTHFVGKEDIEILMHNEIIDVYKYIPINIGDKLINRYLLKTKVKDILAITSENIIIVSN